MVIQKNSEININLKKFDMRMIRDDQVVVFLGKRGTGKSYLVKDLLYHHRDIPVGTCISPTEEANKCFGHNIPPLFIHTQYTPELVHKVVSRQKNMVRRKLEDPNYSNVDPRAFLVMDDCLYDNTWTKDISVREIFMNGRHWKLFYILTMQYPLGVPPNLRTNIDWVFILRENITKNRKTIYEYYAGMFPSFEFFCQVMDQCTDNYECLVIHNGAKSNKIEDQVFWYKAEDHGDFRIGDNVFWQHNNVFYDTEQDRKALQQIGGNNEDYKAMASKSKFHVNIKKNFS